MKIDKSRMLGILGVAMTAILWSSGGILIKLVNWGPVQITGIRSLVASIVIWIYLKKPKFTFSKAQIIAGVALAATMFLFVSANKLTTAANAILLQYTSPIFVALISAFVLKEKVRLLDWVVIAVVLGGLSLFFIDEMTTGHLIGNLLAILSGVAFAVMITAMRFQKEGSPMESTLLGNLLAFVISIPFLINAPVPNATSVLGLVLLGVFQIGFAYIIFSNAMKRVTAMEGVLVSVLEPLLNPVWVALFLGEMPSGNALIGGIIVLIAVTARSVITAKKE